MNRQAAAHIISNTFTKPFDESQFTIFIRNLLNDEIDESKYFDYYGNYIPDAFKGHIKRYKRLGTYTDPEGNKIDILTVHLAREQSLWRARTTQRNFVAWYLKKRDKDAALVAYYTNDPEDWRFSFVRMEYRQELDESGKVRVREELTPARRYSFLVGQNEPSHTAQAQLLPLVEDFQNNPTINEIEKAFSVETVTDRFYKEYRKLFEQLTQELEGIKAKDKLVREEFEKRSIDTANFAKKLLGQIVFLYFLQKKGWLGVGRDEHGRFKSWGHGPKDFLRRLYQKKYIDYDNFFNDILEPLFYTALAIERENDYYDRLDVRIPFLNGGLFDPINGYNWQETDILIDNSFFEDLFQTFDTYNFTVCEDEPLEKEVAVDPEMLGKVFENLLPSNLRKGQGAYYTPRTIVHFMCQETLINYLDSAVNIGRKPISSEIPEQKELFVREKPKQKVLKVIVKQEIIPKRDIEAFIKRGEFAVEYDAAKIKGTKSYQYQVPESVRKNAKLLDEKLANIKVCDPAIGSGAFAVGMMHEIVKARRVLSTYIEDHTGRSTYELKRACIQESIYGVDIDPGAIDIAQLRLWLSLVVDEDDYHSIRPLPNLDYKIMQGDSLIEDFHGISLDFKSKKAGSQTSWISDTELERLIQDLHQKQQDLFNAVRADDKKNLRREVEEAIIAIFRYELERQKYEYFSELKRIKDKAAHFPEGSERTRYFKTEKAKLDRKYGLDIQELEKELREMTHGNVPRNFFPWKLYFADVFKEKGGFDVVIGNPPYVRQETIKDIKPRLKAQFGKFFCGTADLYTYFYKRGIEILHDGGHLCFIAPNKFMRAKYGKNTRKLLSKAVKPKRVIDFGDLPIFDATTYPAIVLVEKKEPGQDETFLAATFTDREQIDQIEKSLSQIAFEVKTSALNEESWNLERPEVLALMEKLRGRGKPLSKDIIFAGIKTGLNRAFVIDQATRQRLIEEDPKSEELIKPWLRGKDIKRWKAQWAGLYVINIPSSANREWPWSHAKTEIEARELFRQAFPAIHDHLSQWEKKLKKRDDQGKFWWELRSCAYYKEFERPKILVPDLSPNPRFAIDKNKFFPDMTAFILTSSDYFLLGLLNSRLLTFFFLRISASVRGQTFRFKKFYMEQIPIPKVTPSQKAPIISLVEKILADPDSPEVPDLERQIDHLVYDLYGLNEEEIAIVEGR